MTNLHLEMMRFAQTVLGPEWNYFDSYAEVTTPGKITDPIRQFARDLGSQRPVYVPVRPLGPPLRCFANVRDYVAQHGGEIVHGWLIWADLDYLMAEFHAVVKREGRLFCVTKQPDGEAQVAFAADAVHREASFGRNENGPCVESYFPVPSTSVHVYERTIRISEEDLEPLKLPK